VGIEVGVKKMVETKAKDKAVIIKPAKPIADKYYGAFKVEKWPENLDEYAAEIMQKKWKQRK
jgi:hypothetical protein